VAVNAVVVETRRHDEPLMRRSIEEAATVTIRNDVTSETGAFLLPYECIGYSPVMMYDTQLQAAGAHQKRGEGNTDISQACISEPMERMSV
jgi:hypothetical protein